MSEHLVVQMPEDTPGQLLLLFHGVGGHPHNLLPLGQLLASEFPAAAIVCVAAPDASGANGGGQWFSVEGVTEDNRADRVAATLPRFVATVRGFQRDTGTTPAQTALIGFSQGAIMALEATAHEEKQPLAGRVVALSGRYARLPQRVPAETTLHLIHGRRDPVIAHEHTVAAAEQLIALGGDVTADVIPLLGHAVDAQVQALVVQRLKTHVPRRLWEQALREAGTPDA